MLLAELFLPEFSACHSFPFTNEIHMTFFQNHEFLLQPASFFVPRNHFVFFPISQVAFNSFSLFPFIT